MKLFISADIEGTAGIVDPDETRLGQAEYNYFRQQMTNEVNAACEGANLAGANEIIVKDAHGTARNLLLDKLPRNASVLRSWAGDPLSMMTGIDDTFEAVMYTGYHSGADSDGNPLAHTMTGKIDHISINGKAASEFVLNTYTAAYYKVPVVFLSGDEALCESARQLCPNLHTVAVIKGMGASTLCKHPETALDEIKTEAKLALTNLKQSGPDKFLIPLPEAFELIIKFKHHTMAHKLSFYPGAERLDPKTLKIQTTDYYEILRFMHFI